MRKLAIVALFLLAVMASLLASKPAIAQSETRTTGYVFPFTNTHIRRNPVVRVGLNVAFPDGDVIDSWDTDQNWEIRVSPEMLVTALPSVKQTGAVGEFYCPSATTAMPWEIRMPRGEANPYLLARRVPEDSLSQQYEEFSGYQSSNRGPRRSDLFVGDNEKAWGLRVRKGDVHQFKLAGLLQLWGTSKDYGTQIGIPIKVERLPEGLEFCKKNREAIKRWMRYESYTIPSAAATPPTTTSNVPATTLGQPAQPPVANPNDARLRAGIMANDRNIKAVNGDLQGFKAETTTVVNGIVVRIEDLEADLAALRATPAPIQPTTPPCPAPVPVSIEIQISGVCDSWYYQVQDNNGVKPQRGPFSLRQGINMIHFDALSNEGSFQIRVFDCKLQRWGEWLTICIAPAMGMQSYAFPQGGAR